MKPKKRFAFSVVELLVALVVFSVAALGGAAALAAAARNQNIAAARRVAVAELRRQAAELDAQACDQLASGRNVIAGGDVTWTVAVTDTLALIRIVAHVRGISTTLRTEVACP